MERKSNTKKLVTAALCTALCVVLPIAVHMIPNAASIISPMHIPVLLCGLYCGGGLGLICGILGPTLSSVLTSMPPMAYLPGMICELAVYGLIAGLMMKHINTGKKIRDIYISLITAMIAGRIVAGVMNALIFVGSSYSMAIWASAYVVNAIPAIVIQLILIPILMSAIEKENSN